MDIQKHKGTRSSTGACYKIYIPRYKQERQHFSLYSIHTYTTELRLPLDKKLHFIRRQTATFLACLDTITLLSTLDLTPTQHKDEL